MLRSFLHALRTTLQGRPLPEAKTPQVRNSAGGFTWTVDPMQRLERFLILGSDSGTYYASRRAALDNDLDGVRAALSADGCEAVSRIVDVSRAGRAPRNDQAILALALALKAGNLDTRRSAAQAVPAVCRTGTHLFQLAAAVDHFGGWGRATRRAFADWYRRHPKRVAYQAVKYRQREGWSHRDLLRKVHAKPPTEEHDALYGWICAGWDGSVPRTPPTDALVLPWAAERAGQVSGVGQIVGLIDAYGLPRECVPTRWLDKPAVWKALLLSGRGMPMTAMLRNLATMTSVGLFEFCEEALEAVCSRLVDPDRLRRARIHPLAVLVALNTYRRGRGLRGSKNWMPHPRILAALDRAFYASFRLQEPTGLRHLLAVDVSGSMGLSVIAGMTGITPQVGAAAMALATLRTEARVHLRAFSHRIVPINISANMRLDRVVNAIERVPFGATDCALPMLHARKRKLKVDVFVVYTDSETWFGDVHPARALRDYRQAMGIDAKLIVVGMVSNDFTIADPDDPGMLDVVGFDTAAPALMREFATM